MAEKDPSLPAEGDADQEAREPVVQSNTVFVGGISWKADEASLSQFFSTFGTVLECKIILDRATGKSKGYGFVTFEDPATAAAVKNSADLNFLGKMMNVGDAYRKHDRRGGGTSRHTPQYQQPVSFYGNQMPYYGGYQYVYPYNYYQYQQGSPPPQAPGSQSPSMDPQASPPFQPYPMYRYGSPVPFDPSMMGPPMHPQAVYYPPYQPMNPEMMGEMVGEYEGEDGEVPLEEGGDDSADASAPQESNGAA